MTEFQEIIGIVLIATQLLCAVTAVIRFNAFQEKIWKRFATYIIIIFVLELSSRIALLPHPLVRKHYYDFFVIPFEFLFLYWMYAQSLRNQKLFWLCAGCYLISFLPHFLLFEEPPLVYSFNYVVGNLILLGLVCMEFYKQIQTDKIIFFNRNMMFYVNTGVILLYIGSLPFFTFYGLLLKEPVLWNQYYAFFMVANTIMYLLFSAALLWGRPNIP